MKKTTTGFSIATIATIALGSLVAHAADQSWAAFTVCGHDLNGNLVLDGGGVKNTSASNKSIACSVGQEQAADTTDDVLVYYSEQSTTDTMGCAVLEYASDHSTQTLGDVKWACSTVGGCAGAPAASFTGTGYMRLADITHGTGWITYFSCGTPNNSIVRSITLDEQ